MPTNTADKQQQRPLLLIFRYKYQVTGHNSLFLLTEGLIKANSWTKVRPAHLHTRQDEIVNVSKKKKVKRITHTKYDMTLYRTRSVFWNWTFKRASITKKINNNNFVRVPLYKFQDKII